jgi:hypothetical protein
MKLNEKGQCPDCKVKPLKYKRPHPPWNLAPFYFCYRCDRAFDADTGEMVENWAWTASGEYKRKGLRQ